MKVIVSEKTLSKVIGKLVTENYDADKLYHRESLVKRLLLSIYLIKPLESFNNTLVSVVPLETFPIINPLRAINSFDI